MKYNRLAALLLALLLLASGCGKSDPPVYTDTAFLFDTVVTITLYGGSQEILQQAFDRCRHYENLLSRTIETSDIGRINRAKGAPVTVDPESAQLIDRGLYFGELSGGLFDITICPASSLWDFTSGRENPKTPDAAALAEAVKRIDYHRVKVSENTVTAEPGTELDLGGIAKGYIADRIAGFVKEKGVKSALVNLGGNVIVVGSKPDGNDFTVGIRKPFDPAGGLAGTLRVRNKTVVTSGTYERYFIADGTLYHHLLDPATGMPVQNELDSVTIVTDSSADADALSTICFIMGREKGTALIESRPDTEAIFIAKSGELSYTSGISEKANPKKLLLTRE